MPKQGSRDLPAVECVAKEMVSNLDRQFIDILSVEIVANVVIARTIVPRQVSGERGEDSSGRKLQKPAIGDGVHAAAHGVVQLPHETISKTLYGGYLQPIIMAVCPRGKLRDGAEPGINGLRVRKRRKASIANCLIAVHLRQIGLVHGASAHVLRVKASRGPKLMFQSKTPFHEIGRVKFSVGHGSDSNWRKTSCGVCLSRRAGKLALRKS